MWFETNLYLSQSLARVLIQIVLPLNLKLKFVYNLSVRQIFVMSLNSDLVSFLPSFLSFLLVHPLPHFLPSPFLLSFPSSFPALFLFAVLLTTLPSPKILHRMFEGHTCLQTNNAMVKSSYNLP